MPAPEIAFEVVSEYGFEVGAFLLIYRMANTSIKEQTQAINQMNEKMNEKLTTLIHKVDK